jgi:hypothetical protein
MILLAGSLAAADGRRIAIQWCAGQPQGEISVTNGALAGNNRFRAAAPGPFRLEVEISGSEAAYGPGPAVVTVKTEHNPFSFFLRDARADHPIYIPEYGVAVTGADDPRSCPQIEQAIRARGLRSKLERVAAEPEENFESAAANTRTVSCQTWLGLSRDIRTIPPRCRVMHSSRTSRPASRRPTNSNPAAAWPHTSQAACSRLRC